MFNKLVTPIARQITTPQDISVDFGYFLEKLLLFDKIVIESIRFNEIPKFVRLFGFDAVINLIKDDSISFNTDIIALGNMSNRELSSDFFYDFGYYRRDPRDGLEKDLTRLKTEIVTSESNFKKLEILLVEKLNNLPDSIDVELFLEFRNDLNTQSNKIIDILKTKFPNDNRKNKIFVELFELSPHRIQVESNITKLYPEFSHKKIYDHIGQSIMGISGLNLRLYKMKHYDSLVGFINDDIPIFNGKLDFLNKKLMHKDYQENFYRILELTNLPNMNYAIKKDNIDINKFLEIRKTDEIQEFRNWLWNLDTYSDQEIKERVNSFKNKLSNFFHSKTGKTLRWLVSSGIGNIPEINFVVGPIISKIDEYVGDKLLKKKGAIAFINNIYPSIFKNSGI